MNPALQLKSGKLLLNRCGGDKLVMFTPSLNEDQEPCCCCKEGCIVTTVTLNRPIVWPGVKRCANGWLKYEYTYTHPAQCSSQTDWRIINLPTCQIIASGKINGGKLEGLKDSACYPMPYEPPCPNRGPFTFSSVLWWLPFAYLAYACDFFDIQWLIGISTTALGLHCDGDLSCRYVLQLQTACVRNGELIWPGHPTPCSPVPRSYSGGIWGDAPDVEVP